MSVTTEHARLSPRSPASVPGVDMVVPGGPLVNREAHRRCGDGQRERWQVARGSTQGLPSGVYQPATHNCPLHFGLTSLAPACTRCCRRWAVCPARRVPASGTSWAAAQRPRVGDQKQAQGIWSRRWGSWRRKSSSTARPGGLPQICTCDHGRPLPFRLAVGYGLHRRTPDQRRSHDGSTHCGQHLGQPS